VKNSNTVSGAASILISTSTAVCVSALGTLVPPLLFQLGSVLQPLETIAPETVEEAPELGKPVRASPVETPGSVAPLGEQASVLQHGQVLGDSRPRHLEAGGDLPRAQLAFPHELEDVAAAGLGDGSGYLVHVPYVSRGLR